MRNHTIRCHFYKSPHSSLWFGYCCYTFARIVISCLSTVKTPLVASLLICIETDRKKAEATFSFERADLYGPIGFEIGEKKVEIPVYYQYLVLKTIPCRKVCCRVDLATKNLDPLPRKNLTG